MSMQDLFGSDSENSDGEKPEESQLPSTQAHMEELFGEASDDSEGPTKTTASPQQQENDDSSGSSSEEDSGGGGGGETFNRQSALNAAPLEKTNNDLNLSDDDSDSDIEIKRPKQTISDISGDDDDDDDDDDQQQKQQQQIGDEKEELREDSFLPTTQDLFGEELDVSSDEDEEQEQNKEKGTSQDVDVKNQQPQIEESDIADENKTSPKNDEDGQQSQDSERPPTPDKEGGEEEEEEGLSIAIELPKCNISLGKELYFIKLPNFLSVDTKPFDANFYEDEIDEDEIQDEEGRARLKLKVENTIRWRYSKDKDGNEIKESNCRFVRWSDGSISMHLGNEVFDVFKMPVQGDQNHLFVQQGTGLQAQAVFKNKLSFRPHSTTSQTHRKMTMSIADRMQKAQRIKMMPAMERDPENQRSSALKKEEERLRSQTRRENQQRRMRERNQSKGLSSNYLEQDMEDEEDFEHSIAAIKNKYKGDVKGGGRNIRDVYSDDSDDDDDDAGEDKLRSAKLDIDSDDDEDGEDEEIKRKKEELAAKKKKAGRKVIEESDEESD